MTPDQALKLIVFMLQRCALNPAEMAGANEAIRTLENATKQSAPTPKAE